MHGPTLQPAPDLVAEAAIETEPRVYLGCTAALTGGGDMPADDDFFITFREDVLQPWPQLVLGAAAEAKPCWRAHFSEQDVGTVVMAASAATTYVHPRMLGPSTSPKSWHATGAAASQLTLPDDLKLQTPSTATAAAAGQWRLHHPFHAPGPALTPLMATLKAVVLCSPTYGPGSPAELVFHSSSPCASLPVCQGMSCCSLGPLALQEADLAAMHPAPAPLQSTLWQTSPWHVTAPDAASIISLKPFQTAPLQQQHDKSLPLLPPPQLQLMQHEHSSMLGTQPPRQPQQPQQLPFQLQPDFAAAVNQLLWKVSVLEGLAPPAGPYRQGLHPELMTLVADLDQELTSCLTLLKVEEGAVRRLLAGEVTK
jgi:hypothetical protein